MSEDVRIEGQRALQPGLHGVDQFVDSLQQRRPSAVINAADGHHAEDPDADMGPEDARRDMIERDARVGALGA